MQAKRQRRNERELRPGAARRVHAQQLHPFVALLAASTIAACSASRPQPDDRAHPWAFGHAGTPAAHGGVSAGDSTQPCAGSDSGTSSHAGCPTDAGDSTTAPAADGGMSQPDAEVSAGAASEPLAPIAVSPEPNLRVAFLGDQGLGDGAASVLQLLIRERPALIVHAGDMSYGENDPLAWEAQIDSALGHDFPYLVAVGNHDLDDWDAARGFADVLNARLARTRGLRCNGELGIQSLCRYRGLELVLSGVGTTGEDHEWFLERTLARPGALVRLCVWHKNQHDMQVGLKTDEVGWAAYQICARHGAPIITGHEHSYARTFMLTALGDHAHGHGAVGLPDALDLGPGRTFVAVSGLGGRSARSRSPDHATDTWWASIYANDFQLRNGQPTGTDTNIRFGALFIDFHVDGDPRHARGYFKTTDDQVVDRFELHFEARE